MKIETADITEEIIDNCQPDECNNCAIYHALKHKYPDKEISVSMEEVKMHDQPYQCTKELTEWQHELIDQYGMPITLEIDHENKTIGMAK